MEEMKENIRVRNRRERRRFWKMMRLGNKHLWDSKSYPPMFLPINLGINQYKKEHPNEPKRVKYYKEEMWKAHYELKG